MITLSDGTTTVTLDQDLIWEDEHSGWAKTEQRVARSLTGRLIVQHAIRVAGRPITLRADDSAAWMTRADMVQLRAWADLPGQTLTLTLNGTAYSVIFRHEDGPFEARAVVEYSDPSTTDWLIPILRFLTVQA